MVHITQLWRFASHRSATVSTKFETLISEFAIVRIWGGGRGSQIPKNFLEEIQKRRQPPPRQMPIYKTR